MKPYIFGERNGIYIIDLQLTLQCFQVAYNFVRDIVASGESVLFVGTKRQAMDIVEEEAKRCGMYYVSQRWLGGMLTNYQTLRRSIGQLKKLDGITNDKAESVAAASVSSIKSLQVPLLVRVDKSLAIASFSSPATNRGDRPPPASSWESASSTSSSTTSR